MQIHIPISGGPALSLELPGDRLIADCSIPQQLPAKLPGLYPSLTEALHSPLGFPQLWQAIVPGDHITIPVDPDTPQAARVVSQLVEELLNVGSELENITVLLAADRGMVLESALLSTLPEAWRGRIQVVVHQLDNEADHAYLATTKDGRPIYLNRALGDADLVIPIGPARMNSGQGQRGIHGSWFPIYSNLEALQRHQSPGNLEWQAHQQRRRDETEEAAWLLGVQFVISVVPGAAGTYVAVLCGDPREVEQVADAAARKCWQFEIEQSADLVVCALGGDAESQSWNQVARALGACAEVVANGGAIALWTELADDPGPAVQSLRERDVDENELRLALLKHGSADATAAKIIADALLSCRVYLRCHVDDGTLEEIGIAPLHSAAELQRLVDQSSSVIAVGSAEWSSVRVRSPLESAL